MAAWKIFWCFFHIFWGSMVGLKIEDVAFASSNAVTIIGLSYFFEKSLTTITGLLEGGLWLQFQSLLGCQNIHLHLHCCYRYYYHYQHNIQVQKQSLATDIFFSKSACVAERIWWRIFLFSWSCSFSFFPAYKTFVSFLFENFLLKNCFLLEVWKISSFFNDLHWEFCGKPDHIKEKACEEFFELKCCSYKHKDLDRNFKVMKRYYILGGIDDHNLKQAYLKMYIELMTIFIIDLKYDNPSIL